MTKQQRKDIYWTAMFEEAAFNNGFWSSLDAAANQFVVPSQYPETQKFKYTELSDPMDRLSKCIPLRTITSLNYYFMTLTRKQYDAIWSHVAVLIGTKVVFECLPSFWMNGEKLSNMAYSLN